MRGEGGKLRIGTTVELFYSGTLSKIFSLTRIYKKQDFRKKNFLSLILSVFTSTSIFNPKDNMIFDFFLFKLIGVSIFN